MTNFLIKKKSKIHGFGIFTEKDISKGEIFYEVPVDSLSDEPKSRYAFIGKGRWLNDPKTLNWVNHSCEANTKLELSGKVPLLISERDIQKGEEITCDYNKTEEGGKNVLCNCKSRNCRKNFLSTG
jgi:SET domain-containing protein